MSIIILTAKMAVTSKFLTCYFIPHTRLKGGKTSENICYFINMFSVDKQRPSAFPITYSNIPTA